MKYKAVVFDYAGVISGESGSKFNQRICELLGVGVDDFIAVYYRYNDLCNIGKISWEELWEKILIEMDRSSYLESVIDLIKKPKKINAEVISLVKELKSLGYTTALLSNYSKKGGERMRKIEHLDTIFDFMLISGETKLAKPNRDAFDNLVDTLKLKAQDIVFIDDAPKNIKTASEMGITSILCSDTKALRKQLIEQGVLK